MAYPHTCVSHQAAPGIRLEDSRAAITKGVPKRRDTCLKHDSSTARSIASSDPVCFIGWAICLLQERTHIRRTSLGA